MVGDKIWTKMYWNEYTCIFNIDKYSRWTVISRNDLGNKRHALNIYYTKINRINVLRWASYVQKLLYSSVKSVPHI